MTIHPDFNDLLRSLEEHRVDYMIVGGYAVAFHGAPRYTKDIDVFYDNGAENVARLQDALVAFGFSRSEVPAEIFTESGSIVTLGAVPTRVDFVNEIDGVDFALAKPNAVRGRYGDAEVTFIGRADLIRNKRSTHRTRDQSDAEELDGA